MEASVPLKAVAQTVMVVDPLASGKWSCQVSVSLQHSQSVGRLKCSDRLALISVAWWVIRHEKKTYWGIFYLGLGKVFVAYVKLDMSQLTFPKPLLPNSDCPIIAKQS